MTETIDIQTLVQDDHNFNKGTDAGRQLMEKSFKELGAGRSILVDKDGRIIAGNKSQQAAIAAGIKKVRIIETTGDELVAVKRTDLSLDSKEGRELALADNLTTQVNLEWDKVELAEVAAQQGIDLPDWGLDPKDFAPDPTEPQEAQEDEFDEEKEVIESRVKRGDVWLLGAHRLMCGDSTDPNNIAALMAGQTADLVLTDPPFGNNLGYGRGQLGERRIENDENPEILYDVFSTIDSALKNNTHCLVWIQWRTFSELEKAFAKYKLRTVVIWDKMQAGLSGGGFAEQYEMLCVFIKGKATQNHYSGNVWQVPRVHAKREDMPHPHQKPIEVLAKAFDMCSKQGDNVLDVFGGSGSTLIAAEQLGRKCFMMELDPHYCDVIIARWEKLTGLKAQRL